MQLEASDYLRLAEKANTILFFDLETQGLTADYGKILVYSRKWWGEKKARSVVGTERQILRAMQADFERADLLVSYNGRLFDVPYANTRLLELGKPALPKKHHLDLYFALKAKLRTTSKSMGAVGSLLGLEESKMAVPAKAWREHDLPLLMKRCDSDVILLQQVYDRCKHLITTINR